MVFDPVRQHVRKPVVCVVESGLGFVTRDMHCVTSGKDSDIAGYSLTAFHLIY